MVKPNGKHCKDIKPVPNVLHFVTNTKGLGEKSKSVLYPGRKLQTNYPIYPVSKYSDNNIELLVG